MKKNSVTKSVARIFETQKLWHEVFDLSVWQSRHGETPCRRDSSMVTDVIPKTSTWRGVVRPTETMFERCSEDAWGPGQ